jgi:hypothetical protein
LLLPRHYYLQGNWALNSVALRKKAERDYFVLHSQYTQAPSFPLSPPDDGEFRGHFVLHGQDGNRKVEDFCALWFEQNSSGGINIRGYNINEFTKTANWGGKNAVTGVIEPVVHEGTRKVMMWRVPFTPEQAAQDKSNPPAAFGRLHFRQAVWTPCACVPVYSAWQQRCVLMHC